MEQVWPRSDRHYYERCCCRCFREDFITPQQFGGGIVGKGVGGWVFGVVFTRPGDLVPFRLTRRPGRFNPNAYRIANHRSIYEFNLFQNEKIHKSVSNSMRIENRKWNYKKILNQYMYVTYTWQYDSKLTRLRSFQGALHFYGILSGKICSRRSHWVTQEWGDPEYGFIKQSNLSVEEDGKSWKLCRHQRNLLFIYCTWCIRREVSKFHILSICCTYYIGLADCVHHSVGKIV